MQGEQKILSPDSGISPCTDCRHCWHAPGCAIDDAMQPVYRYLEDCDNVVLASPIWFSSLSGPLLTIASRLQTYFAASFFRAEPIRLRPKKGAVIIVGGEKGTEKIPVQTARTIMKLMNVDCKSIACVCSLDTNNVPAMSDATAMAAARDAACALNIRPHTS